MDSSCLTASTDQTKPGPSDPWGEKGSDEGWWNWPPSRMCLRGQNRCLISAEGRPEFPDSKLQNDGFARVGDFKVCKFALPSDVMTSPQRAKLFLRQCSASKGGAVRAVTGRPSGLGTERERPRGASTAVRVQAVEEDWCYFPCKVCFCQMDAMIQSHLYLILQVKIQIYINSLHICVYTWLMI